MTLLSVLITQLWEYECVYVFMNHDFGVCANYTIKRVYVCVLGAEARHGGMCLLMALTDHFKKFWVFITKFYLLLRQLKANQNIVPTLQPLQETNWTSTLLICACVCVYKYSPNSLPKSFNCFWTCQMEGVVRSSSFGLPRGCIS